MQPPWSLAVAQSCPVAGDVTANVEAHLTLARLAAAHGAQTVVFPELSLTGYELELAHALAFSATDPRLAPLRALSLDLHLTLIVGAPVRLDSGLHLGACIISPDGFIDWYRKQRLGTFPLSAACDSLDGGIPPSESTVFVPGDRDLLTILGHRQAAVAVCADIGSPAHAQRAAERGADTYLASMFVIPSDYAGDTRRLAGYASQHQILTCLANFGSPSGGLRSAGGSAIWSETGQRLVQLPSDGAGIAVVTETPEGWQPQAYLLK